MKIIIYLGGCIVGPVQGHPVQGGQQHSKQNPAQEQHFIQGESKLGFQLMLIGILPDIRP